MMRPRCYVHNTPTSIHPLPAHPESPPHVQAQARTAHPHARTPAHTPHKDSARVRSARSYKRFLARAFSQHAAATHNTQRAYLFVVYLCGERVQCFRFTGRSAHARLWCSAARLEEAVCLWPKCVRARGRRAKSGRQGGVVNARISGRICFGRRVPNCLRRRLGLHTSAALSRPWRPSLSRARPVEPYALSCCCSNGRIRE
mmetsp:Transcript_25331/g.59107  ORF Transcript_25331/g.59107 Transcript_25331/m.59107 type:complete len:201 (-) Transcript_25331:620-1222(-)